VHIGSADPRDIDVDQRFASRGVVRMRIASDGERLVESLENGGSNPGQLAFSRAQLVEKELPLYQLNSQSYILFIRSRRSLAHSQNR